MMKKYHVNNIVFSSSATVYGDPEIVPLTEDCKLGETTNPYGASKAMMERILTDVQHACPDMSVTLLRYFNPIGAHESGLLGERSKELFQMTAVYYESSCWRTSLFRCLW